MVVALAAAAESDTGPTAEREKPVRAEGAINAETSELGVVASITHDAASTVAGKEGIGVCCNTAQHFFLLVLRVTLLSETDLRCAFQGRGSTERT